MRAWWAGCFVMAWAAVMAAAPVGAAVPDGVPQRPAQFMVVPAEHPRVRTDARANAKIRQAVVIQSSGVSEIVRDGFIRAAICGLLGTAGMIFIGYRLYGRRQGRAAT